jgi:hypothetical protein
MDRFIKKGMMLIDTYDRLQNECKASKSRLDEAKFLEQDEYELLYDVIYQPLEDAVSIIQIQIHQLCNDSVPLYQHFLSNIKGVQTTDAMRLIVYIRHPSRFSNVSKLWKYAGLAPIQYCVNCKKEKEKCVCGCNDTYVGSQRPAKGKAKSYNKEFKKQLIEIGERIIREDKFYKDMYNEYKTQEIGKGEYITPKYAHNKARRKVIKLFLYHLLEAWSLLEGVRLDKPYMRLPKYNKDGGRFV